jgi:hypothetical protein
LGCRSTRTRRRWPHGVQHEPNREEAGRGGGARDSPERGGAAQAPNALAGLRQPTGGAAYQEAAGAAATQATNYGDLISGLMARMDAPDLQRQAEANAYGNLGMDLDVIGANVRNNQFLTGLRVNGIRRNPWIDIAAATASGAASGYGSGGGGKRGPYG